VIPQTNGIMPGTRLKYLESLLMHFVIFMVFWCGESGWATEMPLECSDSRSASNSDTTTCCSNSDGGWTANDHTSKQSSGCTSEGSGAGSGRENLCLKFSWLSKSLKMDHETICQSVPYLIWCYITAK
jgi:hypothetical protein